ncbi:MAG TPA: DUF1648 domain-containing protein [Polyangiales bacterium]
MRDRKLPLLLSLGFALALLVRLMLVADSLPERVASHFDFGGHPDGFQSRHTFVWTTLLLDLALLTLALGLPWLVSRIPLRHLNLPHKEYWFAPERRAASEARLLAWVSWFTCASIGLMCGIFELVIRANLRGGPLSYQAWLLLASYTLFMLFSSVGMLRAFRRP